MPPASNGPYNSQAFNQPAVTDFNTVQPAQRLDLAAASAGQDYYNAQQGGSQQNQSLDYYPTHFNEMQFEGTYQYPGYWGSGPE
jgi:hypothetical protein